jgi:hypothetical protein
VLTKGIVSIVFSVRRIPKSECGSTTSGRSTSAMPTAATASDFIFARVAAPPFIGKGDRNPAVCGVAVGAFDTSAFPPPSDPIWEESMYLWLGLPPGMDHHQQGRITDYMRAEPNRSIIINSILRSHFVTKSFRDNI